MNKKRIIMAGVTAGLLIAAPALAQIKISKDGVNVKTGTAEVTTSKTGTTVDTDEAKVKTGEKGTSVKTRTAKVKTESATANNMVAATEVKCVGTKDIVIEGKRITGKNGAIVTGACDIKIKNSEIDVTGVALKIVGSGDIEIVDSIVKAPLAVSIQGSGEVELENVTLEGEIHITGSGDVSAKNSKIKGKIQKWGTGEFEDEGGNTIEE